MATNVLKAAETLTTIQKDVLKSVTMYAPMDTSVVVSVIRIVFAVSVNALIYVNITSAPRNVLKFVIDLLATIPVTSS